jgi:ribosome-binding factor A
MSRKTEQIAAAMKDAISQVISRGLQDPRVQGLVTITSLTVADDLADATVNVSVLPGEKQAATVEGLNAAAGHIRRELDRYIQMRRVPLIRFRSDSSLKKQLTVMQAINQASEDLAKRSQKLATDTPDEHTEEGA